MTDTQQLAELWRRIQAHLAANRLRDAQAMLIEYCRLNHDDVNAWHTLGQLHGRHNELELAAKCLERVIALKPDNTTARKQLVTAQKQLGNLHEAVRHCRAVLDVNPDSIECLWELGDLSAQLEDFATVEQCCRRVLDCNPSVVAARMYLGVALQRQGRLREAEESLRAAIAAAPDSAEAYFYLGLVLRSLGNTGESLQCYRRALDLGMSGGQVLHNMALLHFQDGNMNEALDCSFQALQCMPQTLEYRQLFVRALRASLPTQISEEMMAEVLRSFECTGIDSVNLMKPGMTILMMDAQMQQLVGLARCGEYDRIHAQMAAGVYDALLKNQLFRCLLLYTRIASAEFEHVLQILRRIALTHVMDPGSAVASVMFVDGAEFAVALASQFYNTEYAANYSVEEAEQLTVVAYELSATSGRGTATDDNALQAIIVVMCMYQPMYSYHNIEQLISVRCQGAGRAFGHLLKTQWLEHLSENGFRQQLTRLTAVTDKTSLEVQEQYEESPYPRWESVMLCKPLAVIDLFTNLCPGCTQPDTGGGRPDVLIAGCGSGRHAIMSATLYGNANVLAVDLSASSLGYAMRKAHELDIDNLRFAQADILELAGIDRKFHIIESVGVLHHLQDPATGLRILVDLLPVHGLIKLGLYSAAGRRDVIAARAYISDRHISATPEGIRKARTEIMSLPENRPEKTVTRFRDFYSMSGCRDLLFHVKEWHFNPGELAALLASTGLRFAGFELSDPEVARRYTNSFPDDPAMLNLDNWRVFESNYPNTFSEMYQFWCQKI